MNEIEKLSAIKRMGEASAQKIAESMSTMFGLEVEMAISSINMVATDNIPKFTGVTNEAIVAGSYIGFSGFLSGSVLCILSIESAREIASILLAGMGEESSEERPVLTEMEQSSITELGNIITSSFIDTWANTLYVEVTQHPPAFSCDYMSAIINASLMDSSKVGEFAFMFDSLISVTDHDVDLEVLVLPDLESMQKIFDRIVISTLDAA